MIPQLTEQGSALKLRLVEPEDSHHQLNICPIRVPAYGLSESQIHAGAKPHQPEGIDFLRTRQAGILADEPGLGKTFQAIRASFALGLSPIVVFCPLSVRDNWAKEFAKFCPLDVDFSPGVITLSTKAKDKKRIADGSYDRRFVYIVNYDVAWRDPIFPFLESVQPKILIFDESHYMKTFTAKRTIAGIDLSSLSSVEHVWALSGTPLINRPAELIPTLEILGLHPLFDDLPYDQDAYGNGDGWDHFRIEYCDPQPRYLTKRYKGRKKLITIWEFKGAANLADLRNRLEPYILRRLWRQTAFDYPVDGEAEHIPEKKRVNLKLSSTDKYLKEYADAEEELIDTLDRLSDSDDTVFNGQEVILLGKLRQLAFLCKAQALAEWIEDWFSENVGRKLVIFAIHKKAVAWLAEKFARFNPVTIDGSTPGNRRQQIVETFQEDPECRLFIGNVQAAGEGITLTAASDVLFAELPWTPKDLVQCEGRVYRISQTRDHVISWVAQAEGTIDSEIHDLIVSKADTFSQLFDTEEISSTDNKITTQNDMQDELLDQIRETRKYRKGKRKK